jgi:hypothetical protein
MSFGSSNVSLGTNRNYPISQPSSPEKSVLTSDDLKTFSSMDISHIEHYCEPQRNQRNERREQGYIEYYNPNQSKQQPKAKSDGISRIEHYSHPKTRSQTAGTTRKFPPRKKRDSIEHYAVLDCKITMFALFPSLPIMPNDLTAHKFPFFQPQIFAITATGSSSMQMMKFMVSSSIPLLQIVSKHMENTSFSNTTGLKQKWSTTTSATNAIYTVDQAATFQTTKNGVATS